MSATSPARPASHARRRTRLARGPLTIGDPAPAIDIRLPASEPYRPDTIADGGSAYGLTVRAASVRGLAKRYLAGPRQDDLCLRLHAPTESLIVAVADGVSASPRSELGAALAVRHGAAAVARQLDCGGELDWAWVVEQAAWALLEQRRRDGDEGDSLATTLTVAVVSGESVQLAAVGDSPAYLLGEEFVPLAGVAASVDGLLGGAVDALPHGAWAFTAVECALPPDSVLLVCTDGLALPLGDGTGEVGRMLTRELGVPPDVADFARLLDFSRATYDDDRTLVAVWPAATG
jgi:serine/threonine protein phosphatase PrpC